MPAGGDQNEYVLGTFLNWLVLMMVDQPFQSQISMWFGVV